MSALELPVPEDELHVGAPRDSISAITEPAFGADWRGMELEVVERLPAGTDTVEFTIEPRLEADDPVIGVERDGVARAYPLRILNWHEVVNDDLGDPLLVTYCPLCGSGVVARREVEGVPTVFGVSGLLFRSNLVLYDRRTESLWSQLAATAIRGPMTGTELDQRPSTLTTWREWRRTHPDSPVLLPPPHSGIVGTDVARDYRVNPYFGYEDTARIGIGFNTFDDDRLHPKTQVIGVASAGEATAYPLPLVRRVRVINDTVGGRPVVIAAGPDDTLVAYDRRVGDETIRFAPAVRGRDRMRGGRTRWAITTGRALSGRHAGAALAPAAAGSPLFWFSWLDFHPDTTVYGG